MPREPPVMRTVCAMSDGNRLLCLEQALVQILALCQTLLNVDIGNNVVIRNNNAVGLALHQSTNCSVAMRVAITRSIADGEPPRWM